MATPYTPAVPSRWLGAAWEDHGLGLKLEADSDGAAAGGCQGTTLLAAEQQVHFLKRDTSGVLCGCHRGRGCLPYAIRVSFSVSVQGAAAPGF